MLELGGYYPQRIELESLQASERRSLRVTLRPIVGSVRVEGEAGMVAKKNPEPSEPGCSVPCTLELLPGERRLWLSRPGFRSASPLASSPAARRRGQGPGAGAERRAHSRRAGHRRVARTRATLGVGAEGDGVGRARVRAEAPLGEHGSIWASAAGAHGSGRDYFFPDLAEADPQSAAATRAGSIR